jgi:geranylgeranyl reductase family protein
LPTQKAAQVIVVGAGPAGASAAFFLAQAGVRVLMVDQATFPRDKPCGDGVASSGLAVLKQMGLMEWVTSNGFLEPRELLFSSPDGLVARKRPDPYQGFSYGYVIPRHELDAAIVERSVAVGARLREGARITGFERLNAHRVRLTGFAGGRSVTLETSLVVAADGGHSSFTRRLGRATDPPDLVAVRGYLEGDIGAPDLAEIHWQKATLPGYAWIFPLGDGRVNVGIGAYSAVVRRRGLNLQGQLAVFLSQNPHARVRLPHARSMSPVRGHPLRTDADRVTPLADNVLVAGEAAGLANPLTGEGIGPALECGKMAAAHAQRALESGDFSTAGLAVYGRAFHQRFDAVHRSARVLRRLLSYRWIANRVVRCAQRDHDFALLLGHIVIGIASPAAALKPSVIARILAC